MTDNIIQGKFGVGRSPQGGPGDGGGDMLEARVGRLEEDVREVKSDMKVLRADVAYAKGRLEDMPTKDWMNTRLLALFGALGVMMAIFVAVAKLI